MAGAGSITLKLANGKQHTVHKPVDKKTGKPGQWNGQAEELEHFLNTNGESIVPIPPKKEKKGKKKPKKKAKRSRMADKMPAVKK